MKLAKINYLNLIPFDIFIKSYPLNYSFKCFLNHHSGYPSKLNKSFLFRRFDASFISSFASMKSGRTRSGIISRGAVWSVLLLKGDDMDDHESASSNALAKCMDLRGQVIIGDKALRLYLDIKSKGIDKDKIFYDLGEEWFKRHHLPFVFGLLSFNAHGKIYHEISKYFNKFRGKVPKYLLNNYANNSNIKAADIIEYLKHIHYEVDNKSSISLQRFFRTTRIKRIVPPKRFN